MKKYTFLLIAVCTFIFNQKMVAQDANLVPGKITWGQEHKSPNNTTMSKIIGTTEKGFYSLRVSSGSLLSGYPEYLVEQFNTKNKVVKSKELEMKYKKKRRDFENIMLLGDKLILFTSFYNDLKKTKYLFAETLSSISLKQKNDLKLVGEIENQKQRRGLFDFSVSEDSSKILVYHSLPYKRKQAEKFAFNVYDSEFEKLWEKEVTLPYEDNRFQINEYMIDNDGNVYVLGKIFEDRKNSSGRDETTSITENNKRNSRNRVTTTNRTGSGGGILFSNKNPNYKFAVLAYRNSGETFKEYQIDLKDRFITDLTFKIQSDGNLTCAGFYSEQNHLNVKGTCFIKIDSETEELIVSNIKEFDFDFVTEYYTKSQKAKAEKAAEKGKTRREAELFRFELDELILRSDGGAVLVAEQFFIEEFQQGDFSNRVNTQTVYEYHYNDIIVVNINPDGSIEWTSRIPKNQETRNDNGYFSSYSMAIVRDRMYFVYNDNSKNFEERGRYRRFPHRFNGNNSIIALSEINQKGEVKKYALGSNREEKILTRPKVCQQTGLYEMVVFGERRGKFKFGTLKFVPQ